jgi:filamentous hemagglutinin
MLVAVEETAIGAGTAARGEATGVRRAGGTGANGARGTDADRAGSRALVNSLFPLRPTVWAASMLLGGLPMLVEAQVVIDPTAGAHGPAVVVTQNGLQQVNITAPSAAGVSQNHYTQFDIPKAGVVLNNSPTIVQADRRRAR